MELQTTFLDAIQAVPGEIPGEKFRSISQFVSDAVKNGEPMSNIIKTQKLPAKFLPLCEIVAAKITKNHQKVAEALKCEDELVLNKALTVTSFFDGTDKDVTNVDYFSKNLLPYVSLKTRLRIIKNLAHHLVKDPKLASEFFIMFYNIYGLVSAQLLLVACSEDFIFTTVIEKNIVFPRRIVKILYRRNPKIVIWYLKWVISVRQSNDRISHRFNLNEYTGFLACLVRKHFEAFVNIMEQLGNNLPHFLLSNNRARRFLKNGRQHLIEKPNLYFDIIPLKLIDDEIMKMVFPKLLPEKSYGFHVDEQLDRLEHYSEKEKALLIMESYEGRYGKRLLDNPENVTPKLMLILPSEVRIQQARNLMKNEENGTKSKSFYFKPFEKAWRCYLPTNETIPLIKEEISKASEMEERRRLLTLMIYTCKVNQDDAALLDVLKYFHKRHRNEQSWLFFEFMGELVDLYNLKALSNEHWSVLQDSIQRMYVKGELTKTAQTTTSKLLESLLHYQLAHNIPIQQTIEMFSEAKAHCCDLYWNILTEFPEYEKMCLDSCIDYILKKHERPTDPQTSSPWNTNNSEILYDILNSVYQYNKQHVHDKKSEEALSLSKYPGLKEAIQRLVVTEKERDRWQYFRLRTLLRENEPNLYETWFEFGEDSEDYKTGRALALLRKDPKSFKLNWEMYLKSCKQYLFVRATVCYVKAMRWYNDIPVIWSSECLKQVMESKDRDALWILAILLDRESFSVLIKPFIPKAPTIEVGSDAAKDDYSLTVRVPRVMRYVNPPPTLEDVEMFCEGDYLSQGLTALTNVCRRSSVAKVLSFAKGLVNQRVSVKKHGLRLICLVATANEINEFLLSKWKVEEHHSIRKELFCKMYDLFLENPSPGIWTSLKQFILDLGLKDEAIFHHARKHDQIPNEYVAEYVKLLYDAINNLDRSGFETGKPVDFISDLLQSVDASTCDLLSQEFCEELLRKFFFHSNIKISQAAKRLVLDSFIFCRSDKAELRMTTFCNVFIDQVPTKWGIPHPKKLHFYPVNYAVHDFVNDLTLNYTSDYFNLHLTDVVLKMFESVIDPKKDAMSYLLLVFANEQLQSKSPREFGAKIGQKLEELLQIYTELIISFVRNALQRFLNSNLWSRMEKGEGIGLGVIEGLLEVEKNYTYLIAAEMLCPIENREHVKRYDNVIRLLTDFQHPAVTSILCDTINSVNFNDCINCIEKW